MADTLTGVNLDALKWQVVSQLDEFPPLRSKEEYWRFIDQRKYAIAQQLNIPLKPDNNGDLPARLAGAIGGRIGGPIGGQMVRYMIALAEQRLAGLS